MRRPAERSPERSTAACESILASNASTLGNHEGWGNHGWAAVSNGPKRPVRPRGHSGGGRKRRVVIDTGAGRPQLGGRQQRDRTDRPPKQPPGAAPTGPVTVESGITVSELSQALGVRMADIIKMLMSINVMKTATQSLADEEVEVISTELGREITIKHVADEELAGGLRGQRRGSRSEATRGHDHGPCRPRQDDSA